MLITYCPEKYTKKKVARRCPPPEQQREPFADYKVLGYPLKEKLSDRVRDILIFSEIFLWTLVNLYSQILSFFNYRRPAPWQ